MIDAYMAGLEDRVAAGGDDHRASHSVASFFVSRVDTEVDKRLDAASAQPDDDSAPRGAAGQGGDRQRASSRTALSGADRVAALEGARRRRAPRCSARSGRARAPRIRRTRDVMYVEQLIGPNTVNTMPPETIDAFRDHGIVARTVDADLDGRRARDRDARDSRHLDRRRHRPSCWSTASPASRSRSTR